MGQSSSGTQPGKRQGQSVANMFLSLQELVGDWTVQQLVFAPQTSERPGERTARQMTNIGRLTCRSLIEGVAIIQIVEIPASGVKRVSLITFNPNTENFELALVDSTSDVGTIPMTGEPLMTRSSEEIRARFGKASTAEREWTLVQPPAGLPETAIVRIVENQITDDKWVNQFFVNGPQGEFLSEEQVLTRVAPGCAAQLGCELGCAGLVTCVLGCEGLQKANGIPQGQAELLAQAQLVALQQLPTEADLLGQPRLTVRAQCGTQEQCGCQAVCLEPPKAPQPPKCPTAPVPPPPVRHGHHGK